MQSTLANLIHLSNCKWTLAGGVQDGMCVSVQYDRLHVVFVVGDNLLAICIRPNGTSREAEERPQLVQILSETPFLKAGSFIKGYCHLNRYKRGH